LQGAGGIGGLLARSDNTQMIIGSPTAHAFYHADGNGNVTMLINSYQAIVAKYLYDPFGNTLSLSGSLADANVYRFSSKEWNDNAGLYYYLYRYYDPNLQRWPNRDPKNEIGFQTLNHIRRSSDVNQEKNLYDFVKNSPIQIYDLNGLQDDNYLGDVIEGLFSFGTGQSNTKAILNAINQCGAHSSGGCWCCVLTIVAEQNSFGELDITSATGQLFKETCNKLPDWAGPPILTPGGSDVRQFHKAW
jgi:RHS repeat-associated protein